ncbi:MAG: hypothetical protein KDD94_10605, partial [Calditrichaeota bacterium]|nr:hypothetical protein [Calditrichota bacterium]
MKHVIIFILSISFLLGQTQLLQGTGSGTGLYYKWVGTPKLGIGNTDPYYELSVVGTGSFTDDVKVGDFLTIRNAAQTHALSVFGHINVGGITQGGTDTIPYGRIYGGIDGNDYIEINGEGSTDHIKFVSGNEIMRLVGSTGNVGIGTTAPSYKLDVAGNAHFNGAITSESDIYLGKTTTYGRIYGGSDSNNDYIEINSEGSTDHIKFVSGNEIMRLVGLNGYVGIGASSPSQKLEVRGNVAIGHRFAYSGNTATNTNDVIIGKPDINGVWNAGSAYMRFKDNSNDGTVNAGTFISFHTHKWSGGTNEAVRIAGNGNVGIGTTGDFQNWASRELALATNSEGEQPAISITGHNSTGNARVASLVFRNTASTDNTLQNRIAGIFAGRGSSVNSGELKFLTHNSTTGYSVRMTIGEDGKVGIGASPSQEVLRVGGDILSSSIVKAGDASGYAALYLNSSDSHVSDIRFQRSGVDNYILRSQYSDDKFYILKGSSYLLTIENNGNIGIGVTTPTEKLDVNGRIHSNQSIDVSGISNPTGNATMNLAYDSSADIGLLRARNW